VFIKVAELASLYHFVACSLLITKVKARRLLGLVRQFLALGTVRLFRMACREAQCGYFDKVWIMCHLILLLPIFALPLFWIFPLDAALPSYAIITGVSFLIYSRVFQASRQVPRTGREAMVGKKGIVIEDIDPAGKIQYAGEIWNATSTGKRFAKGELIRIAAVRNLMLLVEELPNHE
jgi:membrane protein implicated in regulation of membrane protease activity